MKHFLAFTLSIIIFLPTATFACQPCAAYSATELHGFTTQNSSLSVSEIYTKYQSTNGLPRLQNGEILRSYSSTELGYTYDFNKQWSMQLALPIISRNFFEFQNFRRRKTTDTGIGDATISGQFAPVLRNDLNTTQYLAFNVGVKLPTGSSGSTGSTSSQTGATQFQLAHHVGGTSSVQGSGSDLGSGSVDFLVGSKAFLRYKRFFIYGSAQYGIRTEGDNDYQFANDFVWNAGPALYLFLGKHESSAALRAAFSGEKKSNDEINGSVLANTAIDNIFVGPEVLVTLNGRYTTELAIDFPISTRESGAIEEASYRLRAAITYRF